MPDGEPRFGFLNETGSFKIAVLIVSDALCVLLTTGDGPVAGASISPVINVCANPETFERLKDDLDLTAGEILSEEVL